MRRHSFLALGTLCLSPLVWVLGCESSSTGGSADAGPPDGGAFVATEGGPAPDSAIAADARFDRAPPANETCATACAKAPCNALCLTECGEAFTTTDAGPCAAAARALYTCLATATDVSCQGDPTNRQPASATCSVQLETYGDACRK